MEKVLAELVIDRLMQIYKFKKYNKLSEFLGLASNTLSSWKKRNKIDWNLIFSKCENINFNWLITGEGSPEINNEKTLIVIEPFSPFSENEKRGVFRKPYVEEILHIVSSLPPDHREKLLRVTCAMFDIEKENIYLDDGDGKNKKYMD